MGEQADPPAPIDQPDSWGWVAELLPEALGQAADVSLELTLRGPAWVNRRVETIELVDQVVVRQSVSIDFRLPKHLPGGFVVDVRRHHALPLLLLTRRTDLAAFDVTDESGRSLPMLTRNENARLTGLMLLSAAERAVGTGSGNQNEGGGNEEDTLSVPLRIFLAGIPGRGRDRALEMVERVVGADPVLFPEPEVADRLLANPDFRDLLGIFQYASAIHVPMQVAPGERRIVKVCWEGRWGGTWQPDKRPSGIQASARRGWHSVQGFAGWRPVNRVLDLPQLGGAESHHVQIITPAGVEMSEVSAPNVPPRVILPGGSGVPDPKVDRDQPRSQTVSRRVHLYLPEAHDMRAGVLDVNLRAPRHGLLVAAVMTGILVTAILGVYAARAEEIIGQSDTGAAILLLVPALLAGLILRPGEHAMARVLLRGPRLMTTALGVLPLVAAASIVASPNQDRQGLIASLLHVPGTPLPGWLPTLWWALAVVAAMLTVSLGACCVRRPSRQPVATKPEAP